MFWSWVERCPHFRGCYVLDLLERCPHFRGCYVQASVELGPEDVPIGEVSSFQRVLCTGFSGVGT